MDAEEGKADEAIDQVIFKKNYIPSQQNRSNIEKFPPSEPTGSRSQAEVRNQHANASSIGQYAGITLNNF